MNYRHFFSVRVIVAVLVCAASVSLRAQSVTNVLWYHLGEGDGGVAEGAAAAAQTSAGNNALTLTPSGGPTYTLSSAGGYSVLSLSSTAVNFAGAQSLWGGATDLAPTSSFWMEAWIKPTSVAGTSGVFYSGDSGTRGFGLLVYEGRFGSLAGGVAGQLASTTLTAGQWTHIAAVWNQGTLTFFQDGVAAGSFSGQSFNLVNVATDATSIGSLRASGTLMNFFTGAVDEVRLGTFTGTFDAATMLNYSATPIPEPATFAVIGGLLALGGVMWSRRRDRVSV